MFHYKAQKLLNGQCIYIKQEEVCSLKIDTKNIIFLCHFDIVIDKKQLIPRDSHGKQSLCIIEIVTNNHCVFRDSSDLKIKFNPIHAYLYHSN